MTESRTPCPVCEQEYVTCYRINGNPPSLNRCDECDATWLAHTEPTAESFDGLFEIFAALNAPRTTFELAQEPFPGGADEKLWKAPLQALLDLATELEHGPSPTRDEPLRPLLDDEPLFFLRQWDPARHRRGHDYSPLQKRLLVAYLEDCPMLIHDSRPCPDRLEGRFQVTDPASLLSDGTYYWPKELGTYVHTYDLQVPDHALAHIENNLYRPPRFTRDAYVALTEQAFALSSDYWMNQREG